MPTFFSDHQKYFSLKPLEIYQLVGFGQVNLGHCTECLHTSPSTRTQP